ncbi:MAG: ABC transporter ATP-binding protein [Acidimicrobiales bacterium]|jgi:ABC-2 type transport system ATP-binding protein
MSAGQQGYQAPSGLGAPLAADESVALSVRGVTKRFGVRVVIDGLDLSVPRGCAFGCLGPNGAGKTTLIRTVLGLTRPNAGEIRVLGHPMPHDGASALQRVGAIVDEPRFHGYLSGLENLEILASARGGRAAERIWPSLERVGLADRATERVSKYSMGMRQRLGVASCLLADPELLVLDEPMNGLDPAGMQEFRELIRGLVAEGRTVMLSSHLLDEVQKTCEFVAIIDQGRVVVQGAIDDLIRQQAAAVRVICDDPGRAASLLTGLEGIDGVLPSGDNSLSLRIGSGWQPEAMAAAVNRYLVGSGVGVSGLWVERASLEERFLQLTSRFGGP